jgi:hypothetical protein
VTAALTRRLDLAVRRSGLPPALVGRLFGFDGRTLKSWRLAGVPVLRAAEAERWVATLEALVGAGCLPASVEDLAITGLKKLEDDYHESHR